MQCLQVLPSIFRQYGNHLLSFVKDDLPQALQMMLTDICMSAVTDFEKVVALYEFGGVLTQQFGMNAFESIKLLLFHDIDTFNLTHMLM
jgi:hypothetical protein